jgi:hypothetical protein
MYSCIICFHSLRGNVVIVASSMTQDRWFKSLLGYEILGLCTMQCLNWYFLFNVLQIVENKRFKIF